VRQREGQRVGLVGSIGERLLRDGCEAIALVGGRPGEPSSQAVRLWLAFIATPTPSDWHRAHNASIVAGYLDHERLAHAETAPERFFMNVALARALYAHGLVAAPRLALGRFAPLSFSRFAAWSRTTTRSPVTRVVYRRRASWPVARLRGDRAAAATPVRVVRQGARRAASARASSRRQPDLRVALREATRLARSTHAVSRPGTRMHHTGSLNFAHGLVTAVAPGSA
jgi:hypothetical protein